MRVPTFLRLRAWGLALVFLVSTFAGCEKETVPTRYEVLITPDERELGRTEALTLVGRLSPVPKEPVTFRWRTLARLGIINAQTPNGEVDDTNDEGTSQILYSVTQAGNPGGEETINLEVWSSAGTKLGEAQAVMTVPPPDSQEVAAVFTEQVTDGTTPGRETIKFYYAWIFEREPGFSRYAFTLKQGAPDPYDLGPIGVVRIKEIGGGIFDHQMLVNTYGEDLFGLGPTQLAWVVGGTGFSNYDPNNADHLERIAEMREAKGRITAAVYVVGPYIP